MKRNYNEIMIYTITTNPSLDYYMSFKDAIEQGNYFRSINEFYGAGGKGVNVSIFLSALGMASSALGFLGGFTKDKYVDSLNRYPDIQPLFTSIKEDTRINVKVMSSEETSFNAKGPNITDDEFEKFSNRLTNVYDSDIVVLSGNVQDELKDKIVETIGKLIENGTKVILDTSEDVVERCLDFKPYLVRVNERVTSLSEDLILVNSNLLLEKGAQNVCYSSTINPNYYFMNKEVCYKATRSENANVGIGFNDSFIAGILYGVVRGANTKELFQLGVSSSLKLNLAVNYSEHINISSIFEDIEVTEI